MRKGKLEQSGRATDFYVTPNGEVVPATGYRYMDSKYAEQTMESMSAPGSYFGFEKLIRLVLLKMHFRSHQNGAIVSCEENLILCRLLTKCMYLKHMVIKDQS